MVQFCVRCHQFVLCHGWHIAVTFQQQVDSLQCRLCTEHHETVVDIFHISIVGHGKRLLHDDTPRIDVMVEEERCNARLRLAVDDRPVDRCCTTVLWQESGMHIERSEPGHGPYHLGQHAESHHHLQVCPVGAKLLHELRIFHLDRLKHGQVLRQGILLNRRCLQCVLMSSYRFVGLRYHSHHIISTFYKALEGFYRKLRCSHKYNSQIFFLHFLLSSFLYLLFFHFNRALSFTFYHQNYSADMSATICR